MSQLSETRRAQWLLPTLAITALFVLWELTVRLVGAANGPPAPSSVAQSIVWHAGFLGWHAAVTVLEATIGLGIAVTGAFLVSSLFARSRLAHTTFMPLVLVAQTVPMLAVAPLLAQAIGEGLFANIVVTAYLCWFPSVIAFTHGFLTVDPDRLALFEVHGASRSQIWRQLRLPNAAPSMVAGIRTSAGLAVISAVVSEYGTLVGGIGATIVKHIRQIAVLPSDLLYALVVVAALVGLIFTEAVHRLARYILRDWLDDE